MNRREFMQRMFGLTVSIAVGPTIRIATLEEDLYFNAIPVKPADWVRKDMIWIVNSFNLYVDNPAHCARIDGITSKSESTLLARLLHSRRK